MWHMCVCEREFVCGHVTVEGKVSALDVCTYMQWRKEGRVGGEGL